MCLLDILINHVSFASTFSVASPIRSFRHLFCRFFIFNTIDSYSETKMKVHLREITGRHWLIDLFFANLKIIVFFLQN